MNTQVEQTAAPITPHWRDILEYSAIWALYTLADGVEIVCSFLQTWWAGYARAVFVTTLAGLGLAQWDWFMTRFCLTCAWLVEAV
ncbi:hypothetical protein predicted by Glimmer/Critica [Acetobacter senegalensis]|uniref:Uncharacterized protein n=1 Tax=Acetobacter senegalensis TaxID=446692 RepID=A0A0U5EUM1_9PROT|nr:hypothetical protein [Acetobacter senegalensis]CEF41092.1 hypothetical protein predicted by Glimmer/Critica [Acetobacter senegalensis]